MSVEIVTPPALKHPADALLVALVRRIECGRLRLTLPDGRTLDIAGAMPGPQGELTINRRRLVRRLMTGGANGFAEAYIDGDCDSPDLAAFLRLVAANHECLEDALRGRWWSRTAGRLIHAMRPNDRAGAKRNIRAHYDLGNEFYSAWLDQSLTYSAAIFEAPEESLEHAQANKYRRLAEGMALGPYHHVLEVGCGWGGFASWAAKEIGCRWTGITISDAQFEWASQRIQADGLGERITILKCDYRDVRGSYDRIASVEMLEAVGERYWPDYFNSLSQRLKPGGVAGLQVITIADRLFERYRRSADFIQRHVFPGGMLPSAAALKREAERAGFAWRDDRGFAAHYAETLRRWHKRFEAAWPGLSEAGLDERFRRLWRYYLAYCQAGFESERIDVRQLLLAKT